MSGMTDARPSLATRFRGMVRRFRELTDDRGRPVNARKLAEPQGRPLAGARSPMLEDIDTMTPARLRTIFRDVAQGQIYDLAAYTAGVVRHDGHIAAQRRARIHALPGRPWRVVAADATAADERLADEVRAMLAPIIRSSVVALQEAVIGPFAPCEITWETSESQWIPRAVTARDLRWFRVEELGQVRILDEAGAAEELRPWQWIVHRSHLYPGIIARDGLAEAVCVLRLIKSLGVRSWAELAEIFGIPIRIVKYPANASKSAQRDYARMVRAIGLDGWAAIPSTATLEIHEPPASTSGDFHERLVEWANREISKLLVGQTMTADDGSSLAQSKSHLEVFGGLVAADGGVVAEAINAGLVDPFLVLNHGDAARGRVRWEPILDEPEALASWCDSVALMVDHGLEVSQAEVADRLGLAKPAENEPILIPAARATIGRRVTVEDLEAAAEEPEPEPEPPGEGEGEGEGDKVAPPGRPERNAEATGDEVDRIADGVDIEAIASEWSDAINGAAERASSWADFRRKLEAVSVRATATVGGLAAKMLAARGLGDVTDDPG